MAWLFSNIQTLDEPKQDKLAGKVEGHYFRDALSMPLNNPSLSPSQLQHAIFAHMPSWVTGLMRVRNSLVAHLGFEVGADNLAPTCDELNVGDKAGFLTVIEKTQDEIISFAEDKHMIFYISVLKQTNQVIVSTLVNPKTLIGRLYLRSILPFHYVIARTVINNAIKDKRI